MNNTIKISGRQYTAIAFVSLLSPVIRLLPEKSVEQAGRAAWLTPVAVLLPVLLYTWFAFSFLEKRKSGEGLAELIVRCIGDKAGTVVNGLFFVWFVAYAGFVLRSAAERLITTIYENNALLVFSVILLAAAAWAACGRVRSIGRTAELFAPVVAVIITAILLLSLKEFKAENLLPVTWEDTGDILLGALPVANVLGVVSYFMFLAGDLKKEEKEIRRGLRLILAIWAIIFGLIFCSIGQFGAGLISDLRTPFFMMVRNVSLLHVIERMEAVVVALWCVTDFLFLTVLLINARRLLGKVLKRSVGKKWVCGIAAVVLAAALLMAGSDFQIRMISDRIIPTVNLVLVFGLLPIIYIVGRCRKKI